MILFILLIEKQTNFILLLDFSFRFTDSILSHFFFIFSDLLTVLYTFWKNEGSKLNVVNSFEFDFYDIRIILS